MPFATVLALERSHRDQAGQVVSKVNRVELDMRTTLVPRKLNDHFSTR
jgi:hypothetical protein